LIKPIFNFFSHSRQIKVAQLQSEIFSKKKTAEKPKRPPQYEYNIGKSSEKVRSGPNIFKSNILFN
jgi:hypothetical protein